MTQTLPDREEVRVDGPEGSGGVCWISKMIFLPESQGFPFFSTPQRAASRSAAVWVASRARRQASGRFAPTRRRRHATSAVEHTVQGPKPECVYSAKLKGKQRDRGNKTDPQTLSRRGERGLRGQGVTLPVKKKKEKRKASS